MPRPALPSNPFLTLVIAMPKGRNESRCVPALRRAHVLKVAELPEPKMMQDSVLVQVKAAGLNPADGALRDGAMKYAMEAFFPVIPGWDVEVVEDPGPGAPEFAPGDEVIGYVRENLLRAHGGYAEKIAAYVRTLVRKPRNLTWAQAAALPLAGLTAYQGVVHALAVSAGETVLVHAAAGGVGSLAAQIAVARGARVIGTASEANHGYLRSLGVEPVLYGDGLADRVRALATGGVDAVLDIAGRGALATTAHIGRPRVRVASVVGDDRGHDLADGSGVRRAALPVGEQQVPGPISVGASVSTSASAAMRPRSRSAAR